MHVMWKQIKEKRSRERRMNMIPVIDGEKLLSSEEVGEECEKLREACEKWGCFRVMKHPIPLGLMADMKAVVRSLLDLPTHIKKRNTDVIPGSGYMAPTPSNPLFEALGLFDSCSSLAVHHFCSQLDASPHQRQILEAYGQATHKLAEQIAQKMSESLGVSTSVDQFKDWPCRLRMNKYNLSPQNVGQTVVMIHTDPVFLTILQDDDQVGGLQVIDQFGSLVEAPPMPGTFLVNIGDLAHVWSNGRFHNVKHCVQCKEGKIRASIATFMCGPREGNVEAPAEMVDSDHPPLYRPISYKDYTNLAISSRARGVVTLHQLRL